jgi:plasmid stabilization system protein ParE
LARASRSGRGRRAADAARLIFCVARLVWTPRALQDLARVYRFLAPKNRDAARRATRTIRQGVKMLSRHPQIGRPIEEMPPEFREWIIPFGSGAYRVLCRYDAAEIALLAVRHGREAGY